MSTAAAAPAPSFASAYVRPDLAALEREQRALAAEAAAAPSGDALVAVARRWNAARSALDTLQQIATVRYHQNTQDPAARAEEDFFNEAAPLLRELDTLHARTLLDNPHHAALDRAFGPQFLALKACKAVTFAPAIKDAIAEEARLCMRYTELAALADVDFRGEKLNMTGIAKYFVDADRGTRLEAQRARDAFLSRHGAEFDSIYDRLVALRDGMGRALGEKTFTPLGYKLMNRTGYGPDEVAVFREEIRREVVPLAAEITRAQGRRLGLDRVLFHDEPVFDPRGNPAPLGDAAFCTARAQEMYRELGAEFGTFMDMMVSKGLLDLTNRPGKAGGGFCTIFADQKVPFVFANFNGTDGDVRVLTHECGHAFQAWSSREQPVLEYRFPTYEACEVHSMSMEFLTYPFMNLFFGADAQRFQRTHLEQEILALPYMAAVDHFQHDVYANPSMSASDRHAAWKRAESTYLPWRSYGGHFPYLERGTIWQRQLHIFQMPFYYIDYALAMTCALQFWSRASQDRPRALRDYLSICAPGGSLSFTDLISKANLANPFTPGSLRDVVASVRTALNT